MPLGNALACLRTQKIKFFNFDIIISSDTSSWKLKKELTDRGWNGTSPINGTITINSGVTISGTATTSDFRNGGDSFLIENYDIKSIIKVINNGTIIGCGGYGGVCVTGTGVGGTGGNAMKLSNKISLLNNGSIIGGGGGGGACVGGGGGGAGIPAGGGGSGCNGSQNFGIVKYAFIAKEGSSGTNTTGGAGGVPIRGTGNPNYDYPNGGDGGDLGKGGKKSGYLRVLPYQYENNGGGAGSAIWNSSYAIIDTDSTGSIIGPKT